MTATVVHPAELERMLRARLDSARAKRARRRRAPARAGRRGLRRGSSGLVVGLVLALTATAVFADGGTVDVQVANRTGYDVGTTTDGAIVEYIGDQNVTFGSAGTGTFGTFLQTQDDPSEEGYNTDGVTEFDTGSSPNFNRAVLVSTIPIVTCESLDESETSPGLCWELFADINDSNANDPEAAQIQLTELEVWLTDDNEITGYNQTSGGFGADADLVYDFEGNVLINDVNQGSGRGDLRYLIPLNELISPIPPECVFGSTTCTTYFIVYTEWGDPEDGEFSSDSGFEEWKVRTIDLATKSGMKFNDLDADGVKDAGEPGLAGWTIYVDYNNNSVHDVGEPSAVTGAGGTYTITNIIPGTWNVREVAQAGWTCSFPNPCVYNEVFAEGADLTGNDFGNWANATKEGRKFTDVNGDGDDEGGTDPGLGGYVINVYADTDGNGILSSTEFAAGPVGTDTTDAGTGAYSIGNLAPGKYVVCEVQQADWVQTYPGGADECTGSTTLGQDGWAISLASGQTDSGNDFGNFQLINKTGSKYVDDEGDGSISGDSKYTGGWTIRIYKDDGDDTLDAGDTVTSQVTNASGNYAFNDLGPGTYFVCEATASDWIQTFPNTAGGEVIDTCDNIAGNAEFGYKFTASSGVDQTLNDFGNFQLIDKSGFKFNDNDTDAIFEPAPSPQNDAKLSGWTIELWELVSGTWTWVATDVTDGTGYSFPNLGPGTYAVCEVTQTDWVQSYPFSGATVPAGETVFDCTTLTPNSGGTFAAFGFQFTASSGTDQASNNFGNFLVPPGCSLTQGYWKTHSIRGPAAHPDDTWYLLSALGPDTLFFDSGDTWYEVFWTSPKGGNAWYILAHQYMAARLNLLNDAGSPAALAGWLADAETLLNFYDTQKNIPKNANNVLTGEKDRVEAITLAGNLAAYNEGTLPGTSHCGEENFVGFTTAATGSIHLAFLPLGLSSLGMWAVRRRKK